MAILPRSPFPTMRKITIEELDSPVAIKTLAACVLANKGNGTWNGERSAHAAGLVAAAMFNVEPDDVRVTELERIIKLQSIGCNQSAFSIWATSTPKGAAAQNVEGVTRTEKGKAQAVAVGGLLARLQAAGLAAPEVETPAPEGSE